MASDRTAILVKFPAALLQRVDACAAERGKNRMATILMLVEDGLGRGSEPVPVPAPRKDPQRRSAKTALVSGRARGEVSRVVAEQLKREHEAAVSDQAARDAKYARRDTWDPRFAAAPKKGRK